ncbi:MAG TPA: hypothetical protein PKB04_02740 [Phenylobacterium sp.]|uniref:hypothetical protein n=1 Tax=Phenylobacterium sp. TaxID=1871053 RepID=UPI002D0CC059|nr:hypothetical protein [Phenylobacterium sp.]HMP62000.1 hypothetical protein [Phenylobacterium sp.]
MSDAPRPRLFGLAYWAAIAFAVACLAGGVLIARYGPVWFAAPTESLGDRPKSR